MKANVHYHAHKGLSFVPVLSQTNVVHYLENHRIRHGLNHRLPSYTILYGEWQNTSYWKDSPIEPHQNNYWTHKIKLRLPQSIRRCICAQWTPRITYRIKLNSEFCSRRPDPPYIWNNPEYLSFRNHEYVLCFRDQCRSGLRVEAWYDEMACRLLNQN
jgi:hypothetical protein